MTEGDAILRFMARYNLLVILGPTASGKTALAVGVARRIGGEIISADSRQVYRGMDLGTGKDIGDYIEGGEPVPYHLIDILDPGEEFSVFAYQRAFDRCFLEITERKRIPIMVGGTGLYLDAVLRRYRMSAVPESETLRRELEQMDLPSLQRRLLALKGKIHNSTDLLDRQRLVRAIEIAEFKADQPEGPMPILYPLIVGIRCERGELRRKIFQRLHSRLRSGMVEEVKSLHDGGLSWERIDAFGLEYRYVALYLQGRMRFEEMSENLAIKIGQFAKRQETWFRRMERNGVRINWIERADPDAVLALMEQQAA